MGVLNNRQYCVPCQEVHDFRALCNMQDKWRNLTSESAVKQGKAPAGTNPRPRAGRAAGTKEKVRRMPSISCPAYTCTLVRLQMGDCPWVSTRAR